MIFRICIVGFLFLSFAAASAGPTTKFYPATGSQPFVQKPQGSTVKLYSASAALLISESDYAAGASGWQKLPNTSNELDGIAVELVKHGFDVTRVHNAESAGLQSAMSNFLGKYGAQKDVRILFFFSGHGFTNKVNQMSYIVPIDATNPSNDYGGFISRAVPLESFQTWVRSFAAVHVLAIFDTCFSGAIFTTKNESEKANPRPFGVDDRWRYLTLNAEKPVRQFISAGGADEKLPASSTFVPVFIEALRGGASTVNDGFVTGKEVGVFIERVVSERRAGQQNPLSGVSRDANYVFGDIIFQFDPSKVDRYAASPISSKELAQQILPNPLTSEKSDLMPKSELPIRSPTNALCNEISEQTLVNGVVVWQKKCI